ncbi:hypothetical protein BJ170DRAFT_691699 [Xylariales sp. AK1849]|nr:hypothetical protein BJ170DRAFT_691699 [Xylariales sp. AK1849]
MGLQQDPPCGPKQSPRKRATSFAGFLGKIFPSHRPEQGGTLRSENRSGDSGYLDLGIDPEELTQWNIAGDISPRCSAQLETNSHRRAVSSSPQKLMSKHASTQPRLRLQRAVRPGTSLEAQVSLSSPPLVPFHQSGSLSAYQTHALLEAKEQARRQRRELKASGDYLPVTGYDPWTGEWKVLTPTDTLSSDTLSPSMEENMTRLTQNVQDAKLAYDQAKSQAESEKERIHLEKAQAKLDKIEKVKTELRHQDGNTKWSRHRGHWSSAAEPNLSPIAQSLNSGTASLVENIAGPDVSATPQRLVDDEQRHATRPGGLSRFENTDPGRQKRCVDQSSDTIIHTPKKCDSIHVSCAKPAEESKQSSMSKYAGDPGNKEHAMSFLWDHRRKPTDPGGPVEEQALAISTSTTGTSMRPPRPLKVLSSSNHFIDLEIPNHHLGLTTSGKDSVEMSSREDSVSTRYPLTTPPTQINESLEEDNPVLSPVINMGKRQVTTHDISVATATSSQSKLKELMRRPSIPQRLVPSQTGVGRAKDNESIVQALRRSLNILHHQQQVRNSEIEISRETLVTKTERLLQATEDEPSPQWAGKAMQEIESHMETVRESVYIPTTITTGCDLGLLNQPRVQTRHIQVDGPTESTSVVQANPIPQSAHDRTSSASIRTQRGGTASSRPTTPRSGSPSPSYNPATQRVGTAFTRAVTPPRRSFLKECSPVTPRLRNAARLRDSNASQGMTNIITTTSVGRATSQAAHPRQSSDNDLQGVAGQAAARTAMLKSRARVVDVPVAAQRRQSKSPSPIRRSGKSLWIASPSKKLLSPLRVDAADTAGPTKPSITRSQPNAGRKVVQSRKADAVAAIQVSCAVTIQLVFKVIRAWWSVVRPAFDKESPLWRRREKEESTLVDLGVFLFAGLFCGVGALGTWYGLKVLKWLLF